MALLSFVALKTLFLIVIWISMGLCLEIFGPTFKDLVNLFNTDYESLSRAVAARGIGGCIGSVMAGVLADKLPRWLDIMVVIYTASFAVSTGLFSMVTDTDQMWFLCLLLGFGVGGTNIVGQRLILIMWKEKSASPTHALHMGFGIGALIISLIANPFLMVTTQLKTNITESSPLHNNGSVTAGAGDALLTNLSTSESTYQTTNSSLNESFGEQFFSTNISGSGNDFRILTESKASYVFVLVGGLSLLSCLPFIAYQCLNSEKCNPVFRKVTENEIKKSARISFLQMLNPASYTAGSLGFGLVMFTLLFVYFTGTVGGEQLFGTFIRTFSVDLLHFSKDNASYLLMLYWASFTFSRFLGAILSHCIQIKHLILVQAVLNALSVTAITFIKKTKTNLWIFTSLQGLLYAPLFPMGISFANTVMDVRGFCLTTIWLSANLGDLGYIWIAGKLYDYFGPSGIMYTMQASGITILIAAVGFRLVSIRRKIPGGKQFHTAPEKLELSVNSTKRSDEMAGLLDSSEDEL